MTRLVYRGLEASPDVPIQVYWLAGLHRSDQNEWWVRTVFRAQGGGQLHERLLPIGLLPILSLGIWFDQEVLQADGAYGEDMEIRIPDVSRFEVMTSDQVSSDLYPLPEGKADPESSAHRVVEEPSPSVTRAFLFEILPYRRGRPPRNSRRHPRPGRREEGTRKALCRVACRRAQGAPPIGTIRLLAGLQAAGSVAGRERWP